MSDDPMLVIHRSARQIGGNCIELSCGGTRILLDAGQPLDATSKQQPMESLLPATLDLTSAVDAVLLSHPHKDHYGLANLLPGNPPVFGGEDCLELVRLHGRFFDEPIPPNLHPWHHKMPFAIGPFTITPFLTDHSAVDAYMLLIECARRKVLYSGDFRMTGRKSRLVGQLNHELM